MERTNLEGKTALDLSLQRRHRKISWTLIQKGGANCRLGPNRTLRRQTISSSSLFQVTTHTPIKSGYQLGDN